MNSTFHHVAYSETGYFSKLVIDYLEQTATIAPFYRFTPDLTGIEKAIEARPNHPVNREVLVSRLSQQYSKLVVHEKVKENISLLAREQTFTICTAHQPNLLTGYLYFVYKILHAIKLADELNLIHPDKHFVPIYYMGSEDNDIEELGVFRFRGEKFEWDGDGQAGAVGRMDTAGLKPMLDRLLKLFGPPGPYCDQLTEMVLTAYRSHSTIAEATQYLVNELFGRYGLVIINPDDPALKQQFIPVMQDELLHQHAAPIINEQIKDLAQHYKIQAHPRAINLFYLNDQLRERIEQIDHHWVVLNTDIRWTEGEMLLELNAHPERFSPNVMLRGLYQETILPNVAFIGGGAEVAYWMQLKNMFNYYHGFLPVVLLRQSVLVSEVAATKLQQQLALNNADLFKPLHELEHEYIIRVSSTRVSNNQENEMIAAAIDAIKHRAEAIDATLGLSALSVFRKVHHQLQIMEQKMYRAEKKKESVQMQRLGKLKLLLFPSNTLQERTDNFLEFYLNHGFSFFDTVLSGIAPFKQEFLLVHVN